MTEFAGIPISEFNLLLLCILVTVLFVMALGAAAYSGYMVWADHRDTERRIKAGNKRMENLAELSEKEDWAKQEYQRRVDKAKRARIRNRRWNLPNSIVSVLSLITAVATLIFGMLPCWTDYCRKDYEVYTGQFSVIYQGRGEFTELSDGTVLDHAGSLDEGDHVGTVIYSKRTKIFLGAKETN